MPAMPPTSVLMALRGATFSGVIMLALVIAMLLLVPRQIAWMPDGFITPLYALEFVSDFTTARQMFGKDASAITALVQGLKVDMAFLIFYGVFLASCVYALLEQRILRYIALAFAIVAPLADAAENWMLLELLKDVGNATGFHDTTAVNFMWLRMAVVVKFGAIAIVMLRLLRVTAVRGKLGQTLSVMILMNAAATLGSFFSVPYAVEVMVNTITLCWLLLWIMLFFSWKTTRTPLPQ